MLWTIIALLAVLWVVGLVLKVTAGGLIHVLLVIAVGLLIYRLVSSSTA